MLQWPLGSGKICLDLTSPGWDFSTQLSSTPMIEELRSKYHSKDGTHNS